MILYTSTSNRSPIENSFWAFPNPPFRRPESSRVLVYYHHFTHLGLRPPTSAMLLASFPLNST